jgi:hypothetical protein
MGRSDSFCLNYFAKLAEIMKSQRLVSTFLTIHFASLTIRCLFSKIDFRNDEYH